MVLKYFAGCNTSTIRSRQFFIDSGYCYPTNFVSVKYGILKNFPRNAETKVEKSFY